MRYIEAFQRLNGDLTVNRTWLSTKAARLLQQCLAFTLTLSLSGVLPVVGQIKQARADSKSLAKAAIEEGNQIDAQLKMQVRRARHPGTPGTEKGAANAWDIGLIEGRLRAWKAQLETLLALPSEPKKKGDDFASVELKISAINRYLNELTQLTSLRIALGQSHGPAWSGDLALLVPQDLISEIPGMGTPASSRLGDHYMPMIIDRGAAGGTAPGKLRLSTSLVQGLELAHLADVQNDDTNFTMIKYLATRQLLANLSDLRYVSKSHQVEIPQVPARLRAKLETMGLAAEIAEEQHRAIAEPGSRIALLQTFEGIQASLPQFITPELIQGIAIAAAKTGRQRKQAQDPLRQILTAAETENLPAALEMEISAASIPFSTQNPKELGASLRSLLATAKTNTQLKKLLELIADETLGYLSLEKRRAIMAQLEARRTSYEAEISGKLIQDWQAAARAVSEELLYGEQRRNFVQSVFYGAPEAVDATRAGFSGDSVDPSLLSQVFAPELAALAPSDLANEWFQDIRSAGSYLSARAKYNEIVLKEVSPELMTGGIINAAKARAIIHTRDFAPSRLVVTDNTDPRLAERFRARMGNSHRADLLALIQYGDWMGFHRVYLRHNPSVEDVLTEDIKVPDNIRKTFPGIGKLAHKSRAKEYYARVDAAVTNRYPILAAKIPYDLVTHKTGWHKASLHEADDDYDSGNDDRMVYGEYDEVTREPRLADALVALNPRGTCDEATEAKAAELIDLALVRVEDQIRKNIEKVGNAKNAGEIEKVVTTSMMLSLVMHGFPEFRLYEERFLEDLLSPSLTDQLMRKYAGPAMMYGFGAMMFIKGVDWVAKKMVKRAFPITQVFSLGFDSLMAGYMRGAVILMIADSVYQINEQLHMSKERDQAEDFFFCSIEGGCFTDIDQLRAENSAYKLSKWMLYGRLAMDTMLMYLPMARGVYTKWGQKVALKELAQDSEAFAKLGLRIGDFGQVERSMNLARTIRDGRALGTDIIQATAGDEGAWIHVRKGQVLELEDGLHYQVDATGWVRQADAEMLSRLVPQFFHDASSGVTSLATAEGWAALEQGYARLTGKIASGATYRIPTVRERMAVEDAMRALELNPTSSKSWEDIERAQVFHEKAAVGQAAAARVSRAARFLKVYLQASPNIVKTGLEEVTRAERRLIKALNGTQDTESFWECFELMEKVRTLDPSFGPHLPTPPAPQVRPGAN
jgi:hypothetical protein